MDYFKEFPNEKGFFGEYGGSRADPHRFITAKISVKFAEEGFI